MLNKKNLVFDVRSGLVVFLVALPLCLGIALASGAPLFSGLIAGMIGGLVVGSLSGSSLGVSGPAAGLAVIVYGCIQEFGYEGMLYITAIAGILQVLMGFARGGIIAYYFPNSVIRGMLAGIGVLLILKQIPHFFGYDRDPEGDWSFDQVNDHNTISEIYYSIIHNSPGAIIISVISLALLILWETKYVKNKSWLNMIPGALIVVILGGVINNIYMDFFPSLLLDNEVHGDINNFHLVNIPVAGDVSSFIGQFTLPDFSTWKNPAAYGQALIFAIVASLETLLCVEATDKLDPYKRVTPTNRELKAQGAGNLISGMIGGLPVTQVIVRSSTNINSGGRTKMATIFHGIFLAGTIILIPHMLNQIPLASLAAILLVVGYKLAKISIFVDFYRQGWGQFLPFVFTIAGIVFIDFLVGILIGLGTAVCFILINNYRLSYFHHDESAEEEEENTDKPIVLELSEHVPFFSKASIQRKLNETPSGSDIIIDGSKSIYIDKDVVEVIKDFIGYARYTNITVEVKGIPEIEEGRHEPVNEEENESTEASPNNQS